MRKDSPYQNALAATKAFEKLPENRIKVLPTLENPHPIVVDTLKVLMHKGLKGTCWTAQNTPVISLCLDAKILDRALRVSDALFRALESRGVKITTQKIKNDKKETVNATFVLHGIEILYRIEEITRQIPYKREVVEAHRLGIGYLPKYEYRQTGLLRLQGLQGVVNNSILIERSAFRPIEERLNAFVVGIYKQVYKTLDTRQRDKESAQKQQEKEERLRRFKAHLAQKEQQKADLKRMSAAHHEAEQIRQFLRTLEAVGDPDPKWLAWAKEYADELDPVTQNCR